MAALPHDEFIHRLQALFKDLKRMEWHEHLEIVHILLNDNILIKKQLQEMHDEQAVRKEKR